MFLVLYFVWIHWVDGKRRAHSWVSVFLPPRDEQLVISRPQRILILLSSMLAAMASNAFFFGYQPSNIEAQARRVGAFFLANIAPDAFSPMAGTLCADIHARDGPVFDCIPDSVSAGRWN